MSIWYHGSPRLFEKLEIGHPAFSPTSSGKSIYLTKSKNLAKYYGYEGYVYTVEVKPVSAITANAYDMLSVNSGNGKPLDIKCLEVFDVSGLNILSVERV